MSLDGKNIASVFALLTLSVVVTVVIMVINDKIFLQDIRTEFVSQNLSSIGKHIEGAPNSPIAIDVRWPIQSIVFFYSLMCMYWYSVGIFCLRMFSGNIYWYGIGVSITTSLIFSDLAMPLYVLATVAGIRWSLLKCKRGNKLGGKTHKGGESN